MGFNTNRRGNSTSISTGVDTVPTGTSWDGLEDFFNEYMPAVGTSAAVPHVGLQVRDLRAQSLALAQSSAQYPGHLGEVPIPLFFPMDGGRVVAFCNGKQTHDVVCYLLDRLPTGADATLFGYTFDHPRIADRMTAAACRGVDVTMYLNTEEVDGEKERTRTPSVLLRMLGGCREAGDGSEHRLRVRKLRGCSLSSVYSGWARPLANRNCYKQGAQHSKVFSAGRFLIIGSTNWTVSSEANQELSVLLYIEPSGNELRARAIADMGLTARAVSFRDIQETVERVGVGFLSAQERNEIHRFRNPTQSR